MKTPKEIIAAEVVFSMEALIALRHHAHRTQKSNDIIEILLTNEEQLEASQWYLNQQKQVEFACDEILENQHGERFCPII